VCADASAKLYRPHAYYAAKVAATTPFQIISALVFCFTVYGMAGLRPGTRFILENGVTSTLLSLIAVQVSRPPSSHLLNVSILPLFAWPLLCMRQN
jgi:hypothetical protein